MSGSVVSARRFHGLMPYRVREVLLVASPYDAFTLEEDGLLTEQVFLEYMDVSQPGAPRFTHARSGAEAMALLRQRRFDLVLTTAALLDMPAEQLGREVKALRPGRPVVLLALDRAALGEPGGPAGLQALDREAFDAAFLWGGDAKILLAIIKSVEDRENVDHDIAAARREPTPAEDCSCTGSSGSLARTWAAKASPAPSSSTPPRGSRRSQMTPMTYRR